MNQLIQEQIHLHRSLGIILKRRRIGFINDRFVERFIQELAHGDHRALSTGNRSHLRFQAEIEAIPESDAIQLAGMTWQTIDDPSLPITETIPPRLQIRGKAPEGGTVSIRMHSDPVVVTASTDANGDWVYFLEDALGEGHHEIYITVDDEQGRPTSRSSVFSFLVASAAASTGPDAAAVVAPTVSSSDAIVANYLIIAGGMIVGVFLLFVLLKRILQKKSSTGTR